MLLSLKSAFHLFKSIIVTKFVQYLKLNKNTMVTIVLDSCFIVLVVSLQLYFRSKLKLSFSALNFLKQILPFSHFGRFS